MHITACAIVKDEEKNILNWLACVKKIADEIIVVDTGSSDNTKALVQKNDAKIYDFKWVDDFAAAKNYALSKAHGDWIIFLDADEYLAEDSINILLKYIKKYHALIHTDALLTKIVNIDKNDNILSSFFSIRIFRKNENIFYKGCVHEVLSRHDGKKISAVETPAVTVYHTGYAPNATAEKTERNLRLLKKDIRLNGLKTTHFIYLAECYYNLGKYKKAAASCRSYLQRVSNDIGMRPYIYCRLIDSLSADKMPVQNLINVAETAIADIPDIPEFYFYKGKFLYEMNKFAEADQTLKKSLSIYENTTREKYSVDVFYNKIPFLYDFLTNIAIMKNDLKGAIVYCGKMLVADLYNKTIFEKFYSLLNPYDTASKISILNEFYTATKKNVSFLAQVLASYGFDKTALYYQSILRDKYKTKVPRELGIDAAQAANFINAASVFQNNLDILYKSLLVLAEDNVNKGSPISTNILPRKYTDVLQNKGNENLCAEDNSIREEVDAMKKFLYVKKS